MKKSTFFLIAVLLTVSWAARADSFTFAQKVNGNWQPVPSGSQITYNISTATILMEYVGVTNTANAVRNVNLLKVYVKKATNPFLDGFCWGPRCYDNGETRSAVPLKLNPNATVYDQFQIHYDPKYKSDETVIKYSIWSNEIGTDTAFIIVHIVSSATGIETGNNRILSDVSPNPCSNKAIFCLSSPDDQSGKIVICNLMGERIKELGVLPGQTEVNADLSGLPEGIYLYFIESGKTGIRAKKLVIRR